MYVFMRIALNFLQINDALFVILFLINMIVFTLGFWSYKIIVKALRIQVETKWRNFWVNYFEKNYLLSLIAQSYYEQMKSQVLGVFVNVLKYQPLLLGIVSVFKSTVISSPVQKRSILHMNIYLFYTN